MNPDFWDNFWLAAKYTAPIITGAFGFYAVVVDFRVEKGGRKVLSAKAYWGMALLIVGTALAVGGDAHKDRKDDETTRATAASLESVGGSLKAVSANLDQTVQTLDKTKTQVDNNLKTTTSVLQETLKVADPIDQNFSAIYARIGVSPKNALAQAYIKRVMPEHANYFEFNVGEAGFPDEKLDGALLANLAGFTKVSLRFYDPTRPENTSELSLFARCDKSGGAVDRGKLEKRISYHGPDRYFPETPLEISCMTPDVGHSVESGADVLRSYRQLRGLTVFVRVGLFMEAGHPGIDFNLLQFTLVTSTSREFNLPALKPTVCPGLIAYESNVLTEDDVCFEARIPRNFRF